MHRILARPLASRVAAPAAAAAAKMTSVSGDTAATSHVRRCHTAPPPPPPTEEDEAIAATTIRDAASASSKPDDITSHFLASFLADISGDGVVKPSPEERAVRAAKPQAPAAAEVAESEPEVKPVASTKKSTKPKSRKQSPKEQVPTTTAVSSVAVAASAAMSSTAKLVHDMASAAKARVVPTVEIGEAPLRFEPTTPTPPVVADESTVTVTDPSDVGVFIVDVSVKVPNALGLDYDPAGFAISVLNTGAASVESGYPRTVNFAHGIRDAKAIERLRRILYPDAAEPKKLAAGITVDPKTGKAKGGHEIVLVPSATTHVVVLRSVLNRAAAGKYSVLPLWRLPPPPTADLSVALEDLNDVVLISSALAQACTAKSVHETVSDIVARSRATGTPLDCVSVKPPQRLINYTEIDKSLDEGHFNAQCNSILASPLAEQPTVSEVKDQFKRELVANSKMEASKQPIGAASKSEPTTSASALKKVASAKPPRNGADWLGGLNFDAELARVVGAEKKIVRAPVPKTSKRLGRIAKALKKSGASSRVTAAAAAAAAKKTKKKKAPALIKMGKRMTAKGLRVAKQKRVQGAPGSAKKKIIVVIPKKSKKAAVSAPKKKKAAAAATVVTASKKLLAAAKSAKKPLPKPPVSAKIASAVAKKAPAARKSSPPVKASPLRSTSPSAGSKKGVAAPTKKPTNTKKSTASATKTKAPPKKPSMKPSMKPSKK